MNWSELSLKEQSECFTQTDVQHDPQRLSRSVLLGSGDRWRHSCSVHPSVWTWCSSGVGWPVYSDLTRKLFRARPRQVPDFQNKTPFNYVAFMNQRNDLTPLDGGLKPRGPKPCHCWAEPGGLGLTEFERGLIVGARMDVQSFRHKRNSSTVSCFNRN